MWQQLLISMLPGLINMFFGDKGKNLSNLAGLFGQGYQSAQNYQNQQQNIDWQRNFAMQQFNYNSMLNDRSFFNSLPAAQVQKFKAAGLSPDLLYGQLSSMDYGNTQSLQMPNASSPNFAGLENANLLKDLSKKDSEIGLNLSQEEINKVDKQLKDLDELYKTMTTQDKIEQEKLKTGFMKLNNQLVESNVEKNRIDNIKLATSLGLVRTIEDDRIVYNTTPKFKEICSLYLKNVQKDYDIKVQELENLEKKFEDLETTIRLKDSEILINSVAYQQEVLELIGNAISSGVNLKQDSKGGWVIDYDGDTGDVASVVAMGLIGTVLEAIGVRFGFGKNASKIMGEHKHTSRTTSTVTTDNTNRNISTPYTGR